MMRYTNQLFRVSSSKRIVQGVPVVLALTWSKDMRNIRSLGFQTSHLHTTQSSSATSSSYVAWDDTKANDQNISGNKMPPFHAAKIGHLRTFELPDNVEDSTESQAIADAMIKEWRTTGIFQVRMTQSQQKVLTECFEASKSFFQLPHEKKAKCVDDQSFAGYIASGEEITDGIKDYSEIFTITKDLDQFDERVQAKWPCHGPTPWPNEVYKSKMNSFMALLGQTGEKLMQLTALGLGLKDSKPFLEMTQDGWHHMRVLRFPHVNKTNGQGKKGRGIGSHTDYGLLVIAAQDDVGGLFIRPPIDGETNKNWETSTAGKNEDDGNWLFVPPVENTLTVFPGDMMQFLTNGYLPSTPHKVGLNYDERFACAYFHEPNFSSVIKTLPEFQEKIHYGTHFTNMFMRNYPERITADRVHKEGRLDVLKGLREKAIDEIGVVGQSF